MVRALAILSLILALVAGLGWQQAQLARAKYIEAQAAVEREHKLRLADQRVSHRYILAYKKLQESNRSQRDAIETALDAAPTWRDTPVPSAVQSALGMRD